MKNNLNISLKYFNENSKKNISYLMIYKCCMLTLTKTSEITIVFVKKKKIHKLNYKYRKINSPTNILTFVYKKKKKIKADIILCQEIIIKEAKELRKTFLFHMINLIIHGMLHSQGYNHKNKKNFLKMKKIEIMILKKLGFKNFFNNKNI